jgi:hypothetical protein
MRRRGLCASQSRCAEPQSLHPKLDAQWVHIRTATLHSHWRIFPDICLCFFAMMWGADGYHSRLNG